MYIINTMKKCSKNVQKCSKNVQKMFKKNQRTHSKVAEHTDMKFRYTGYLFSNIVQWITAHYSTVVL